MVLIKRLILLKDHFNIRIFINGNVYLEHGDFVPATFYNNK